MKQKGAKRKKSMPVSQVLEILARFRQLSDQEKEAILIKIRDLEQLK